MKMQWLNAPIIFPIIEIMEAIILATKVTIGEITDIIVEIIPPINDTIGEIAEIIEAITLITTETMDTTTDIIFVSTGTIA